MNALVIAAVLIIQTYDGQTQVSSPLSDEGCEVARCLAQYGHSCEEEDKENASFKKWQEEQRKHPSNCTLTSCAVTVISPWTESMARPNSATKKALCVK